MLICLRLIADAFCLIGANPDVVHFFSVFVYATKGTISGAVAVTNLNHQPFFLVSNLSVCVLPIMPLLLAPALHHMIAWSLTPIPFLS